MISWTIAGKVIDIYDDPHLGIVNSEDGIEKVGSLNITSLEDLKTMPDNNFALIVEDESGKLHRRFPVFCEDQVKLSMYYLENTGKVLMPLARNTAAKNLVKLAKSLNLEYPDVLSAWAEGDSANVNYVGYMDQIKHAMLNTKPKFERAPIEKTASTEVPETAREGLTAACLARAELIEDNDVKDSLRKLASEGIGKSSDKVISALKAVDDHFGLSKYSRQIGTPEHAVSSEMPRIETIKVGEIDISVDDLRALAGREDLLKDILNPGVMHEFMADPKEVFSAFPQDTQEFVATELIPKLHE